MSASEQIDETTDPSAGRGVEYEATVVGVADDEIDPLQAVLISTSTDEHGTPVSVYLTLTPQVIVRLTAELHEVLRAQRLALGFDPDAPAGVLAAYDEFDQDDDQDDDPEDEDEDPRERLLKRAGDPAGFRYLRARAQNNPRVNLYIAAAVIALLLLVLGLKLFGH
jgi:hypothetical protein